MRAAARSHRRDTNHGEIVSELRQCGYSVVDLSQIGHGCPDILAGINGHERLVELKSADGELSADQIEWQATWKGPPVIVARTTEEVLYAFLKIMGER